VLGRAKLTFALLGEKSQQMGRAGIIGVLLEKLVGRGRWMASSLVPGGVMRAIVAQVPSAE